MRAFIYTGGPMNAWDVLERPGRDDLRIAADSGYRHAAELGERVDILVGDFDSLGIPAPRGRDAPEICALPVEKDETDTQRATRLALERGAGEIVLVGSLSGRLDHTLSSLWILEDLYRRGVGAVLTDGQNRVRYLRDSSLRIERSPYRYFSLIAADETVEGVDVEGARYPLRGAVLRRSCQYAVSNEIAGDAAVVTVRRGGVFVIESRDAAG